MRPLLYASIAACLAAFAVTFVLLTRSDEAEAEVILEPTASTGEDPFTDSVAMEDIPEVRAGDVELVSGGGESVESVTGSSPGLYGGTGEEAVCDAEALVAFLEENPDKAAAFAEPLAIRPDDIGDYVSKLTPVVLREDTRVTNHGFTDGTANPFQAVLQAGTAVMVDDRGIPRIRCACGNPLAEPDEAGGTPEFKGEQWEDFDNERLVAVSESEEPVESFELVDVNTGESYEQAVGGGGGDPRDLVFDFGGVGALRIGMTVREVEEATGLEVELSQPNSEFPCSHVSFLGFDELTGLAGDGKRIGALSAFDTTAETTEGVGIGSTVDEVRETYPDAREEEGFYDPRTQRLIVENDEGQILHFFTDPSGRITGITVGIDPDALAPEGCI